MSFSSDNTTKAAAPPGSLSHEDGSLFTPEVSEPDLIWTWIFIPFHLCSIFPLLFLFPGGGTKCRKYLSCCYTIHIFNLTRKLVQLYGTFIFFCTFLFSSVSNKQALRAAPPAPKQAPHHWQPDCACSIRSWAWHLWLTHSHCIRP